jgi:hypothetical protein
MRLSPPIGTRPPKSRVDPQLRGIRLPSSRTKRPPGPRSDRAPEEEQNIVCAVCGAVITRRDLAQRVNNRHEHAFFNPAGMTFEIRCFRRAPGVESQGEPSPEFTWFAGYHWQIVVCASCRTHLGWLFRRLEDGDVFFGLISNRLA